MKTGLILEGGAKRGIYTAGVLDIFLEHGIRFDGVIGVSAGAIHGCSYVSEQIGRSIRYNLNYGNDYRFMSFRSWLLSGNVVDTKFCYHELPEKLDVFDYKTFEKSKTAFYVTCSNVETGKPEYIRCLDMLAEIDYLRASASLPVVSKMVKIGGKKYLDGGICDSIPLRAFMNIGYDRNVVVCTRPRGYRKKPSKMSWLTKLVYRQYPDFVKAAENRHLMYNQELDDIEQLEKEGKVLVIRPSQTIKIGKMEHNLDIVRQMYDLGRADAEEIWPQVQQFLSAENF